MEKGSPVSTECELIVTVVVCICLEITRSSESLSSVSHIRYTSSPLEVQRNSSLLRY